jgi:hypothetical protein
MDKQEIERKIIEIARKVAESTDSNSMARLSGRLQCLFEILDILTVETPAAEQPKTRMMICSGAKSGLPCAACMHASPHPEHPYCSRPCYGDVTCREVPA